MPIVVVWSPTTVVLIGAIHAVQVPVTHPGGVDAAMVRAEEVSRGTRGDGGVCTAKHSCREMNPPPPQKKRTHGLRALCLENSISAKTLVVSG